MRTMIFAMILMAAAGAGFAQETPAPADAAGERASIAAAPAGFPPREALPAAVSESSGEDEKAEAAEASAQTQAVYTRPSGKQRFRNYANSMFGPMALAQRAAQAGFGTWRNSPEEWGDSWEGFGRRFASGTGKSVIKNSAMYGLDEVLTVDSKFYRSRKRAIGSRIGNAVASPFLARRPDGSRTIGVPRLVGTYASNIIAAEAWYPARYDWKDGLKSGTMSLGFTAAFNLIKEFVWKK